MRRGKTPLALQMDMTGADGVGKRDYLAIYLHIFLVNHLESFVKLSKQDGM